jgi:hypothetical protein
MYSVHLSEGILTPPCSILARSKNTVLITSDEALRHAATDNSVNCHGTCWLIDYLANDRLITYTETIAGTI